MNPAKEPKTYLERVEELEAQGLTNCEACDIAEVELLEGLIEIGSDPYAKQLYEGLGPEKWIRKT